MGAELFQRRVAVLDMVVEALAGEAGEGEEHRLAINDRRGNAVVIDDAAAKVVGHQHATGRHGFGSYHFRLPKRSLFVPR